jgi:hypothetical protein
MGPQRSVPPQGPHYGESAYLISPLAFPPCDLSSTPIHTAAQAGGITELDDNRRQKAASTWCVRSAASSRTIAPWAACAPRARGRRQCGRRGLLPECVSEFQYHDPN